LGLEAQKEIIRYFIERDKGDWVADYEECYTGTELSGCAELRKAMNHAKNIGATLIIAKTDRFRNTAEALKIYEEMGDGHLMFCDLPSSDKFSLTLFFALAEREALIVSIRTKQALAVKKAHGCKLGASSEKYKETYYSKPKELIDKCNMEKGRMKRERWQAKKETQMFAQIIRKEFPDHCTSDDITKWEWLGINCKRPHLDRMLDSMAEYKSIDSSLFRKWDFSKSISDNAQSLRSYMQRFKRSYGIV
jgi:DNA invertase Pin-like site-specific DNA recombinase